MIDHSHGVLVGVDGTLASDEACRYACDRALAHRLSLTLVHAWQPTSVYRDGQRLEAPVWGGESLVQAAAQQVLDRAVELVARRAPGLACAHHLVRGVTVEVLVQASHHARSMVVGGRERGRHDLSWLGSVPLHLVTRAAAPVVVVPTDPRTEGDVVVGLDDSALSTAAAGYAFAQAAVAGVGVQALRAFTPAFAGLRPDSRQEADRREDARRGLDAFVQPWQKAYPQVPVTQVLSSEHPLRALREAGDDAGLIVVGSHGRGVVWRHALGSVSSALLRVATCPVAVVGPDVPARPAVDGRAGA